MYQICRPSSDGPESNRDSVFAELVQHPSSASARGLLERFLKANPKDPIAMRLTERLPHWLPQRGAPLSEGPELQRRRSQSHSFPRKPSSGSSSSCTDSAVGSPMEL